MFRQENRDFEDSGSQSDFFAVNWIIYEMVNGISLNRALLPSLYSPMYKHIHTLIAPMPNTGTKQ